MPQRRFVRSEGRRMSELQPRNASHGRAHSMYAPDVVINVMPQPAQVPLAPPTVGEDSGNGWYR